MWPLENQTMIYHTTLQAFRILMRTLDSREDLDGLVWGPQDYSDRWMVLAS